MAQYRRQHWVPAFYLRYFATNETAATDSPQIWATPVDPDSGDAFRVGIAKIATKAFMYSPKMEDGSRDHAVEHRLQELESLMAQVWPRLATSHFYMDETFRQGMSLFLATLMLRNPAHRARNRTIYKMIVESVESNATDANQPPLIHDALSSYTDWSLFCNATEDDHHKHFVKDIQCMASYLAKLLLAKTPWWICFSDKPVFATSDHPVACWNAENKVPGLGRPDTIVHFPISPTRMLVIGDDSKPDNSANPIVPGGEGYFNQFIFRSANLWMLTSKEPTDLFANMALHLEALTGQLDTQTFLLRLRT